MCSVSAKKQNYSQVKVIIIDFYDSFTYNIAHYVEKLKVEVDVIRHDELTLSTLTEYDKIILSPGPGLPSEKTNLHSVINDFVGKKPILGVCLGMQAIGLFLGGKLINQAFVKHGIQESVTIVKESVLLEQLPAKFSVGLYHSWAVGELDEQFVTAISENEVIMAIESSSQLLFGVQFHPESIMTENGLEILSNFINFRP